MGKALAAIADELGCSERTLRRYVREGSLRARESLPRALELPLAEERYLKQHWELLSRLKSALRTERDVRLAVLFGSVATGEDRPDSDIDILVSRRSSSQRSKAATSLRLRHAIGRPVHLVDLDQAQTSARLLADVLIEGRPLLDRDELWDDLCAQRDEVLIRARDEEDALTADVWRIAAESRANAA